MVRIKLNDEEISRLIVVLGEVADTGTPSSVARCWARELHRKLIKARNYAIGNRFKITAMKAAQVDKQLEELST